MALTKAHNRMIEGAHINVVDFGATGDGATNDTTAVQAAIDASGGKPVVFNAGKTFLCTALTVTSNTHLIINGTLKAHASIGSNPLVSGTTISDVLIEGTGIVDGNKDNVGAVQLTGIKLDTATNCQVRDITIQNCYLENNPGIDGAGLWVEGGSGNSAINVTSDNHRGNGFVFGNNTDSYTQNCRSSNNSFGSGIAHTRGTRAKSINDFAESNGFSNITINCEESQIISPTSRSSGYTGINIGHDSEASDASRTTLIGGVSENNNFEGVTITGSDNVTIIGTYCNNNGGTSDRHGIDGRNNVNGLHIIGCKVTASKNAGIRIFEGENHRIESCKLYGNDRNGISMNASNVQVSDCEVFNNNQLGGTNRAGIQFLNLSTGCVISNCNFYDSQVNDRVNEYYATQNKTEFNYRFKISNVNEIVVKKNGVTLTEGASNDYTVSGVGDADGGLVTLTSGATAGDIINLSKEYTATSGQTVFAYTFKIQSKEQVVVLKNGTELTEGTNYTVSGVGNDNGGNVTLTSGATAGDSIIVYKWTQSYGVQAVSGNHFVTTSTFLNNRESETNTVSSGTISLSQNIVGTDAMSGSFTLTVNTTSTVIANNNALSPGRIIIYPRNSTAAAIQARVQSAGANTSFTVFHNTAAGSEVFNYIIM